MGAPEQEKWTVMMKESTMVRRRRKRWKRKHRVVRLKVAGPRLAVVRGMQEMGVFSSRSMVALAPGLSDLLKDGLCLSRVFMRRQQMKILLIASATLVKSGTYISIWTVAQGM